MIDGCLHVAEKTLLFHRRGAAGRGETGRGQAGPGRCGPRPARPVRTQLREEVIYLPPSLINQATEVCFCLCLSDDSGFHSFFLPPASQERTQRSGVFTRAGNKGILDQTRQSFVQSHSPFRALKISDIRSRSRRSKTNLVPDIDIVARTCLVGCTSLVVRLGLFFHFRCGCFSHIVRQLVTDLKSFCRVKGFIHSFVLFIFLGTGVTVMTWVVYPKNFLGVGEFKDDPSRRLRASLMRRSSDGRFS